MPSPDIFRGGQSRERILRDLVRAATGTGDPGLTEAMGIEQRSWQEFEAALQAYRADPTDGNATRLRERGAVALGLMTWGKDAFDLLDLVAAEISAAWARADGSGRWLTSDGAGVWLASSAAAPTVPSWSRADQSGRWLLADGSGAWLRAA